VKCDNFVAKDIVSSLDVRRDSHGSAIAGLDELIRCPSSRDRSLADKSTRIDLEELQCGLIHIGAVAIALGEVGNHWAMMVIWPSAPGHFHGATGGDWCR
jgi:hypothetical protein